MNLFRTCIHVRPSPLHSLWSHCVQPSSESLKSDATAVARHLVENVGIEELVIHGESIGGMAAAGASKALTEKLNKNSGISLLICDRTFCNLEAVAQRLIGEVAFCHGVYVCTLFLESDAYVFRHRGLDGKRNTTPYTFLEYGCCK